MARGAGFICVPVLATCNLSPATAPISDIPVGAASTTGRKANVTGKCTKLRVTQIGGIAGNVAMPPLIDLDRRILDAQGSALMDAACSQLIAAQPAGTGTGAPLGADLPGYLIETQDEQDRPHAFSLAGSQTQLGADAVADVPQLLAPLLGLPQAAQ